MLPTTSINTLTPPASLVQTWCLLLQVDGEEVSKHAQEMLLNAFGDMWQAVEYVKKNNIKV
jgi:hypothetical protein